MRHYRTFATEAQAQAFVEGVEFVNDSGLHLVRLGLRREDGLWVVVLEDGDADYDNDAEG